MKITSKPCSTIKNKTGSWRTYIPKINLEKCIGCGICEKICPEMAIKMIENKDKKQKPKINYDYCKGCGLCEKECPTKAIKMNLDNK